MLPDRHVPAPESARRQWLIRSVSIAALLVTAAYLTWRAGFTIDLSYWWVALPLLVLEFHNALGLLMFSVALWDVDVHPARPKEARAGLKVAVLINEQAIFYRVIAPGKNRWHAAFWCGTSALLRTNALRQVGGVATETVTEDIHTTVRIHRRGWETVYHNEVLARGLAARSLDEYLLQRHRWATGAMQVLRSENPLTSQGLSFGQRLSYATTLWAWFDSWRSLSYIVLPALALATAAVPISAPVAVFGPAFLGTLTIQFIAMRLLARGYYPPFLSILFKFLRMPAVLAGTLSLFRRKSQTFRVTPKGRQAERLRQPLPRLFVALLAGSAAAVAWFALSMAGLTPMHYESPAAMGGVAFFLVGNSLVLAAAARRIRNTRFGSDRRAGARLDVLLAGTINDTPCEVLDLSLTGARVETRSALWLASQPVRLTLDIAGRIVEIHGLVKRIGTTTPDRADLGVEFGPGQQRALAKLAVGLLSSEGHKEPTVPGAVPRVAGDRPAEPVSGAF